MNKLWRIVLHEYRRNVLKRGFILALLSVPIMLSVNIGMGMFLESRKNNYAPLGYVDQSGLLADPIPAPLASHVKRVPLRPFPTEEDARAALEAGAIQAYYVLSARFVSTGRAELAYLEPPGGNATSQFYDFIQINLLSDQAPEVARRATLGTDVIVRWPQGRRELPRGGPTLGIVLPLIMGVALAFLLAIGSGYTMSAFVEEKENRTIELLVTSVSPSQLISGKILGIVATNLTQLVVWTAIGVLALLIAGRAGFAWFQDPRVDWSNVLTAAAIGIPAYVLATALMTVAGAVLTSGQEGQSTGAIFAALHLAPMWFAWAFIEKGDSPLALVFSLLPGTALLTTSMRNLFGVVPAWQVLASAAIQTACALGALWLAGRAFRLGMLRYGQRLRWRELLAALPNRHARRG